MKSQRSRISAYALIYDANRILLCRLSEEMPRWEGLWTLPGGGLEFGERPEYAVVREVEEETGLLVAVRSIAKIDSLHDTSGPDDFHCIRILYHVEILGGRLRHETSGSTDCCEWHRLHPTPDVPLGDLAEVGVHVAQETWPQLQPPTEPSGRGNLRPIAVCVFSHRGRILVSAEQDVSKDPNILSAGRRRHRVRRVECGGDRPRGSRRARRPSDESTVVRRARQHFYMQRPARP